MRSILLPYTHIPVQDIGATDSMIQSMIKHEVAQYYLLSQSHSTKTDITDFFSAKILF